MLMRRYGATLQSVEPDFDPRALSEIAFRRNRKAALPVEEWETGWARVRENVVVEGENRFHFHWSVDPPLRVAVFRRKAP